MLRSWIVAGLSMALLAGVAIGQDPPPRPPTVTNPTWVARPTVDIMARLMPPAAMASGKSGRTELLCTVGTTGLMKDCVVILEDPPGYGFATAALASSSYFQIRPQLVDGKPVEASVIVPIRWDCSQCGRSNGPVPTDTLYRSAPWTVAPSYDDWSRAFPARAKAANASGAVTLICRFKDHGAISNCNIQTENPRGMGFGQAAQSLVRHFRGPAVDAKGASTKGALVSLQVAFPKVVLDAGRAGASAPLIQGVSAEALAAAFPQSARSASVTNGRAVLSCALSDAGEPGDCSVRTETPPGMGFGAAALGIAPHLRYSLWSEDGQPVNRSIALPVSFDWSPPGEESAQLLVSRAERAFNAGRLDEALTDLSALLARFGGDQALIRSARPLIARVTATANRNGRHSHLLPLYDAMVSATPDDANLLNERCWFKATRDIAIESAVADCDKAIVLNASEANYWDSRGFAHLKRGDLAKALADYEQSLKLRPNDAHSLYGRGVTKLRMGDRRGGEADISAAQRVNRDISRLFAEYGVRR